jgi:hypothetical protein
MPCSAMIRNFGIRRGGLGMQLADRLTFVGSPSFFRVTVLRSRFAAGRYRSTCAAGCGTARQLPGK